MKKKPKFSLKNIKKDFNKVKAFSFTYLRTNLLFVSFVLVNFFNASLLRYFTLEGATNIKPFLADFAILLLIGSISYFFKPHKQFRYFAFWTILTAGICFINSVYYTNFHSFASLSLLSTSLQLVGVADAIPAIAQLRDFTFFIPVIIFFLINRSLKKKGYYDFVSKLESGKVRAINTAVVGLLIFGLFMSMLTGTDLSRLRNSWNRPHVVRHFGIYAYQLHDIFASIRPQISPLFGLDSAMRDFREYFETRDQQRPNNKYTNIYEGKNLIMIHAESIQSFLIGATINGREVTPNLNRLAREGINFSNFYAQDSVGTSSDTEFTLNTGLMPALSGTAFVNFWNREYVSIPKLLGEQGYYSFSMHANVASFWNRSVMYPRLGYDSFYARESFEIDEVIGLGLSDKSFFRQAIPIISRIDEEHTNFYGTIIMLTNHTPWRDIDPHTEDFDLFWKYIDPLTGEVMRAPYLEGTRMGSYVRSVFYADAAIGQFIDDLDAAGLLENTVIGIYGDHDAKLRRTDFSLYYNYDPYTQRIRDSDDPEFIEIDYYWYELNRRVPFILWNKNDKKGLEITEVMGMYDIMPTLGNMFNFFNPFAMGNDIFSVENNIVVFPNTNWLTNNMYFNSQREDGFLLNPLSPVSLDYMIENSRIAEQKVSISNNIIVYDLIRRLREQEEMELNN